MKEDGATLCLIPGRTPQRDRIARERLARGVGTLVRARRKACKASVQEVADVVAMATQDLYRLETGFHLPRLDVMARIAGALGCGLRDLVPEDKTVQ